jgi:hypothetical protein
MSSVSELAWLQITMKEPHLMHKLQSSHNFESKISIKILRISLDLLFWETFTVPISDALVEISIRKFKDEMQFIAFSQDFFQSYNIHMIIYLLQGL